jgi:hypothetical protein
MIVGFANGFQLAGPLSLNEIEYVIGSSMTIIPTIRRALPTLPSFFGSHS